MAIALAQAEVTAAANAASVTTSFASIPTSGNLLLAVGYFECFFKWQCFGDWRIELY